MSKAIFIYRDGELVGNATGYTTEKGAKKSLVGCSDWYKVMKPYKTVYKDDEIPQEYKEMGIYEWSKYTNSWLFKREVWSRKVWNEYVKKHYQFVEKDFNIDIK
jgi:hypothetical protein